MTCSGIDLRQAGPVVAVEQLLELGDELVLVLLRVADAEVGEPLRQRLDVLVGDVDEEARRLREVLVRELSGQAEVDQADLVGPHDEDVCRVRVAVEDAVAEDHRHPRLGDDLRQAPALLHPVRHRVDVRELEALEELEREHPRTRVAPVDLRHH